MSSLKIAVLWITGILIWIFTLSVGLAWYKFGYLDVDTIRTMGLLLLPLVITAIAILIWADSKEPLKKKEPEKARERLPELVNTASEGGAQ